MDIERVRRKRQKNVQEQTLLRREALLRTATFYRNNPDRIPLALRQYARGQAIDWDRSIFMELNPNIYGGYWVSGMLLTQEHRFIEFDLPTNEDHSALDGSAKVIWLDVSARICTSRHLRGTGISEGALALEIQAALNNEDEPDA
ncbi:hypothetical protein K8U54_21900 [Pseudomonas fulva]|uniref:hypothetical protein n=1 Tax=Pseudomonas fulva TaxID=47880 RepID=UPI00201E6891|nr:hypothetical protein [Pseudomonas fulva]UQY34331.1 hypothetical protein K8U54_21900 [Pseudomonas fulva]